MAGSETLYLEWHTFKSLVYLIICLDYYLIDLSIRKVWCRLCRTVRNLFSWDRGNPNQAQLVSIRAKSSEKALFRGGSKIFGSKVAWLEIGSKNFGSQLGSAPSHRKLAFTQAKHEPFFANWITTITNEITDFLSFQSQFTTFSSFQH